MKSEVMAEVISALMCLLIAKVVKVILMFNLRGGEVGEKRKLLASKFKLFKEKNDLVSICLSQHFLPLISSNQQLS